MAANPKSHERTMGPRGLQQGRSVSFTLTVTWQSQPDGTELKDMLHSYLPDTIYSASKGTVESGALPKDLPAVVMGHHREEKGTSFPPQYNNNNTDKEWEQQAVQLQSGNNQTEKRSCSPREQAVRSGSLGGMTHRRAFQTHVMTAAACLVHSLQRTDPSDANGMWPNVVEKDGVQST
ncbi:unnamed protein product [Pleuronectes platessa]|uniref:Uncharacterized protein n=1 Tax=Pleuronectes platessa TaxID=8262 RepID=A0A9N7UGQ4_PLEPL|nr:unnamed protein product [Pleuronectes platessa]